MSFEMALTGTEAQTIMDKLGGRVDEIHPLGPRCVVAVYERGEQKTAGGLIVPGTVGANDRSQGKVGLLVKAGATAFTEDDQHSWGSSPPQIGQWVAFRVGDTAQMECGSGEGKVRLRVVEDVDIIMVVDRPDVVS